MADLERIQSQVIALLGAGTRALDGTPDYGLALGDKARSNAEIEATVINAAMTVARAVCETTGYPLRTPFLENVPLAHGQELPLHYGDTVPPVIVPYDGSDVTIVGTRTTFDKIDSFRRNTNNVYGPTHNATPISHLAGYYDIVNDIFYFTGFSATMKLAIFDRDDVIAKLDDGLEPVVSTLACGMSAKEGDTSDGLFANWYQMAMADINAIRAGATVFQPTDDLIAARGAKT